MSAGMRRTWTAIGLAAAAAGLTAPPAGAAVDSLVAAGPAETAHFTWTEPADPGVIHARRLTQAGTLGVVQPMSPAGASGQSIGVDSAGNAVIAWLASGVVKIRRRTPAGALSGTESLSPAGAFAFGLRLDVEPDGDAVAVWNRELNGKYVIQARRRSATGTLSPVYTLSYAGGYSVSADVAVTPGGAATVTWIRRGPEPERDYYVQTRTIAGDGTLSEVQRLSATTASASPAKVAVSDAGIATIAWARQADNAVNTAFYRLRAADGTLGTPVQFADKVAFDSFTVAGNGTGRTAFAWLENNGGVHTAKARIRAAEGGLGAPFVVAPGSPTRHPETAMDLGGHVTFAWPESAGADRRNHLRRRSAAGYWNPERVVSPLSGRAGSPHLAVDESGKATVAWQVEDPTDESGEYDVFMRRVTAGGTMSPAPVQVDG